MRVPPEEFEALVEQALDGLPECHTNFGSDRKENIYPAAEFYKAHFLALAYFHAGG